MDAGVEKPRISVLYVDDEPGLLEIGKLFLEDNGDVCVDTETSARTALVTLEKTAYDAIISDYQMPEMDGLAFLVEVRKQFPEIPFILFTGRGREEVVIEAINNGADFYLQKGGEPMSQFTELAHKIRQAVRRRKAERALEESRDYLNLIFSSVKAGILVIDAVSHGIVDINPAAAEMIGLPREQIVGKNCHKYVCPAETGKCPITDLGHSVDNSEKILITAEGKHIPIIKYVTTVMLSGKPCLLETFIDNTQRKQAEQDLRKAYDELRMHQEEIQAAYAELAGNEQILMHDYSTLIESERSLKESAEQFKTLFDSANDAIFVVSDGVFVRCNARTRVIFGCSDISEVLGHSPAEFSPEFQPDGTRSMERVRENDRAALEGIPLFFEWVHTRRDGTPFYTEVSLNAVEIGGEMCVQSIVRDISDRKRAEQAAALASRKLFMMNEFTRHEITNTITGLLGLVDMAYGMPAGEGRDQLNREIKGLVVDIQKQVAFTKEYQEVGVKEPRWQQVREMIPTSSRPGIHVSPSLDEVEIFADPLVAKIFTYLAENVVRHGERATRITIGAEQHGSGLKVIVEDNGVGVPEAMKAAIFEKKIGERKGMGLFLVREILGITGITIEETGTFGKGARFEIRVPEGGFRYGKNGKAVAVEEKIPEGVPERS
ncbi:multi-sensor signal transduction histidine kinase [Methanoregula boonei 6A8]|jgi:PAS domain S-box-containing protein|uniref:Multi-sensor signal transduction histidine kinase n=1 Tax=Methanoregula boonei (strain DSM 21154 / JCM 14090 / 6A8) TaxID=456442 RepID=A7IA60_METB6|nr:PAS domain S-box protein [Methanoregula boonei]ABS56621.1 multi-sensor signal transduction histidine kinase [Methanoregula boonei 6A8]